MDHSKLMGKQLGGSIIILLKKKKKGGSAFI
jgi:hypothetical protein